MFWTFSTLHIKSMLPFGLGYNTKMYMYTHVYIYMSVNFITFILQHVFHRFWNTLQNRAIHSSWLLWRICRNWWDVYERYSIFILRLEICSYCRLFKICVHRWSPMVNDTWIFMSICCSYIRFPLHNPIILNFNLCLG